MHLANTITPNESPSNYICKSPPLSLSPSHVQFTHFHPGVGTVRTVVQRKDVIISLNLTIGTKAVAGWYSFLPVQFGSLSSGKYGQLISVTSSEIHTSLKDRNACVPICK